MVEAMSTKAEKGEEGMITYDDQRKVKLVPDD